MDTGLDFEKKKERLNEKRLDMDNNGFGYWMKWIIVEKKEWVKMVK